MQGGTVTAGNSSQTSDGAGALLLVSAEALKKYDLTPIAKFSGFAVEAGLSTVAPSVVEGAKAERRISL